MSDDLIKRLENAQGPSERLDTEIAYAIGWTRGPWQEDDEAGPFQEWISPAGEHQGFTGSACRSPHNLRYTASIDAAMTLLPDDCYLVQLRNLSPTRWYAEVGSKHDDSRTEEGESTTGAIALCIAALRARAAVAAKTEA